MSSPLISGRDVACARLASCEQVPPKNNIFGTHLVLKINVETVLSKTTCKPGPESCLTGNRAVKWLDFIDQKTHPCP
ncbi:unnamed protein product [Gordionus sp. m RMFG-2023]